MLLISGRLKIPNLLIRNLIYGKFTNEQLQILFSWIESAYEAGLDDGYDTGREY